MTKTQQKQLVLLLLSFCAFLLAKVTPSSSSEYVAPEVYGLGTPSSTIVTNAMVIRAVDGDTIDVKLDTQVAEQKIRLLGINTPESVDPRRAVECFGKEASAFTGTMVNNRRVELREDPQADSIDKYGRLLRNVYLEDGTDVNLELVKRGYAYAYLDFPLNKQRKAQLQQAETEAREQQQGLWSTSTCNGTKEL